MSLTNFLDYPGMGSAVVSDEVVFLWGPNTWYVTKSIPISSAAVDARSSTTSFLQPGLVMGRVFSTKEFVNYAATNTNGSQVAEGVLLHSVDTISRLTNAAADKLGALVVAGAIKGGNLGGLDSVARSQMANRFIFDDDIAGGHWPWAQQKDKTADYTVGSDTSALLESGCLFTNTGDANAINFTLPTLAAGLTYTFLAVADFSLTVTSAAGDDMIVPNDVAADSVAFSTAGDIIGGCVRVSSNAAGTKWIVQKLCSNAMTIVT